MTKEVFVAMGQAFDNAFIGEMVGKNGEKETYVVFPSNVDGRTDSIRKNSTAWLKSNGSVDVCIAPFDGVLGKVEAMSKGNVRTPAGYFCNVVHFRKDVSTETLINFLKAFFLTTNSYKLQNVKDASKDVKGVEKIA